MAARSVPSAPARERVWETGPIVAFTILCLLTLLTALLTVPTVLVGGDHIIHGWTVLEIGSDPFEANIARGMAWGMAGCSVLLALWATRVALRSLPRRLALLPIGLVIASVLLGFATSQVPFETCHLYFPDCVRP